MTVVVIRAIITQRSGVHVMFAFAKLVVTAASASALAVSPINDVDAWTVDNSHTRVGFSVRHFFTPVDGQFGDFTVDLAWDRANPARSTVQARINVASVRTGNGKRDEHVRSADFFDAATHGAITFRSTSVRAIDATHAVATGDLTIKGVTKRIEMPSTLLGVQEIPAAMQEMLGGAQRVASFEAGLTIDRRDFKVGTGSWGETAVVGGDVTIKIQLEAFEK